MEAKTINMTPEVIAQSQVILTEMDKLLDIIKEQNNDSEIIHVGADIVARGISEHVDVFDSNVYDKDGNEIGFMLDRIYRNGKTETYMIRTHEEEGNEEEDNENE